jgi:hypothetical protein
MRWQSHPKMLGNTVMPKLRLRRTTRSSTVKKSVSKKVVEVEDEEVSLSQSEVYDLVGKSAGGLCGLFEPDQDYSKKGDAFQYRIYDETTKQMICDQLLEKLHNLESGYNFRA